jgi:hypothetical protein
MSTLELRVTHKYVGTYQHEDVWKDLGSFEITYTERWVREQEDEQDFIEPLKQIHTVHVDSDAPVEEISQALQDTFTQVGCHHEYDCCGCRSYYAKKPTRISDDSSVWNIEVNSWRNY